MIELSKIPENPGCYVYKDADKKILYIGKAKNLKKRVTQYFQNKVHDSKTQILIKNIDSVDFIVTQNEVEALVLENNLIKKYLPKYNISLKDSKRYAYILVTAEKFPRILVARNKNEKGSYIGPFVSAAERDHLLEFLRRNFQLRTCKRMPKKTCIRYHMKKCLAPCIGKASEAEYHAIIEKALAILKGKNEELLLRLGKEMNEESKKGRYERALQLRNEIQAIQYLNEKQNMERSVSYEEDIINYVEKSGTIYLMVFNISSGMLFNKQEYVFASYEKFLSDFIVQYYSDNPIPSEVILKESIDPSIPDFLSIKKGKKVTVHIPKQGDRKQLLDLVEKNIEINFFGDLAKLIALQKALKLGEEPKVIECFDISHLSGSSMVGSMVQFRNAIPDKSNYRRFKIRTVEHINDTAAISEIVQRRYSRLLSFGEPLPGLIVIDGGRGQLNSALQVLDALGVSIPVVSLAKRLEEIYVHGLPFPIRLDRKDKALHILQEIRDEAHRFAVSYNRLLRKKKLIE